MDTLKINDFELPERDSEFGKKHFKIYYDEKLDGYFIQDLGDGSGTFCQIERRLVILCVM